LEKSFRYATGVLPWINPLFYRSAVRRDKKEVTTASGKAAERAH
jgi:hypothetical protein